MMEPEVVIRGGAVGDGRAAQGESPMRGDRTGHTEVGAGSRPGCAASCDEWVRRCARLIEYHTTYDAQCSGPVAHASSCHV